MIFLSILYRQSFCLLIVLFSSFQCLCFYFFFVAFFALAKTSSILLNKNGKNEHFCFVLNLKEKIQC
jgi:hypothetical protein